MVAMEARLKLAGSTCCSTVDMRANSAASQSWIVLYACAATWRQHTRGTDKHEPRCPLTPTTHARREWGIARCCVRVGNRARRAREGNAP